MRKSKQFGFTLVELLVVISIIGMLAALLLPAVQSAREAARVMQCTNSQRNLATAVATITATRDEYPGWSQWIYKDTTDRDNKDRSDKDVFGSWVVPLLMNLEQSQLYDKFKDGTIKYTDVPTLPILFCPTSAMEKAPGLTTYVANCGIPDLFNSTRDSTEYDGTTVGQTADPQGTADGVFIDKTLSSKRVTSDSFKDGKSNTVLFTENLQTINWVYTRDNDTTCGRDSSTYASIIQENAVGFCWPVNSNLGGESVPFEMNKDNFNSKIDVPFWIGVGKNLTSSDVDVTRVNYKFARPSSLHNGIIVMAFADVSTRTIADSIDPLLLKKIMAPNDSKSYLTKADKELVPDYSTL